MAGKTKKIRIFDSMFLGDPYESSFSTSHLFEWDRESTDNDLAFYTDNDLKRVFVTPYIKKKIAWLIEPRSTRPDTYEWIVEFYDHFDIVLTFDKELLKLNDKFVFCPIGGCWIEKNDWAIHEKSKNVSMISSLKAITPGQLLRHAVINSLLYRVDVYGRGHQDIDNKITGLKHYRFSIAMENANFRYYFTEKIIDCFLTGTIPLYWGSPDIHYFFNSAGIIQFNSIEQLSERLNEIQRTGYDIYYNQRINAVKENFELAKNYTGVEDWIYNNILKADERN